MQNPRPFSFDIAARLSNGRGRAGVIHTPHGDIETPAFIPVGTKATVKAVTPELVGGAAGAVGAQAVLANTYHLYLQPGADIVRAGGGLGAFMNWPGPTFTDSGGFQAFSLAGGMKFERDPRDEPIDLAKVDDDGVAFKSVIDGSAHRFTPEKSVEIQREIGADIIFALDECAAIGAPREAQEKAVARTTAWAARCLAEHRRLGPSAATGAPQALFGIIQGGKHEGLRVRSAREIGALRDAGGAGFDGFGIGGTFEKEDMPTAVGWVVDELGRAGGGSGDKPRHLLGIGEPVDLILGIENGADTFDCVAPTRLGRNGAAYVHGSGDNGRGRVNLLNARFATVEAAQSRAPIDPGCQCYACAHYSAAYIAHLFRAKEMLAATLTSVHNLHFLVTLAKEARQAIIAGDDAFELFKKKRFEGISQA